MTAIEATFVDLRTVKTRAVLQIILELPLERADEALQALGGIPQPGTDRWVGIARLTPPEARAEPAEPHKDLARSMAGKARYAAQTPGERAVVRAGVLAKDERFQAWLVETGRTGQPNEHVAADFIRRACRCQKSRSEIATDPDCLRHFEAFEAAYRDYRKGYEAL
jgi:hypothetical protein